MLAVVSKLIISVVFSVLCILRYHQIGSDGENNKTNAYKLHKYLRPKVGMMTILIIANFFLLIIGILPTKGLDWVGYCHYQQKSGEMNTFFARYAPSLECISYLFQLVAWILCLLLQTYEYKKDQDEVWYV